jgi:HlyD family secretion protein
MTRTTTPNDDAMAAILADGRRGSRWRRPRTLIVVAVVLALAALVFLGTRPGGHAPSPHFTTEAVARGDLTVTVSATGNLEPTNQVDVGSEVSGLIEEVFVDDNDRVTSGQVLARLDTSKLHDAVVNSEAALAAAEARVLQSEASVKEANANLTRLQRVAELSGGKVPSELELETAEATLAKARAEEASARASVAQARASLSSARTSLDKASIVSPINGIVLERAIEPGQTVAASFQAPVLFTLAEDLAAMELQVDVDEADVGQVREGQRAVFTVDAYPHRQFPALIRRVAYGSQTKDGVVSYPTVLSVDNDDLSLRPGMTATAEITTLERSDVLLVPNAALRFSPPVPAAPPRERRSVVSRLLPRPPRMGGRSPRTRNGSNDTPTVWVLENGRPVPVAVTVGASDGSRTEITGGDLQAGEAVITESLGTSS